ncbi:MAG: D-alanine--D-alanine ligase [Colwellia sp.]
MSNVDIQHATALTENQNVQLAKLKSEKLAVLYGGDSAERDVSLNSGKAIANGLELAGFNVALIDAKGLKLSSLAELGIQRVFIALHGRGGEDGRLQGALEYLGLPYTGSNVLGSALSMDKTRSKQVFKANNLPTAPFDIVNKQNMEVLDANALLEKLGGKVMVKPANEGSSIGMAIAKTGDALTTALNHALNFDEEILVEAWIDGPEYTVAILGEQALPAIHMETPREFYDYEAKYQSTTTQYHCPCGLPKVEEDELKSISLQAFKATGASGWGRVDVMKNSAGEWQILEVNTVPGMTETSLVPKAAKVFGLSFSELVERIVLTSDIAN